MINLKKISRLLKILILNLIIFFILFELILRFIFYHPTRFYYPIPSHTIDRQNDWNVDYIVDWRSGHRISECEKNKPSDKKILLVGDSFTFGAGLMIEDTLYYNISCNFKPKVDNLGALGTGIDFYSKVILQSNLHVVDEIIILFFDNDTDIKKPSNFFQEIKNKVRYSSFSYTVLRSLSRKMKTISILKKKEENLEFSNPEFIFDKNSNLLERWFITSKEKEEYIKFKFENEFKKLRNTINNLDKDIKLKLMVIPEPSVVSDIHRSYYTEIGSLFLPNKFEISIMTKIVKELSDKYSFEYLPFYEEIIKSYQFKQKDYYFETDFHLNKEGNKFLFEFIVDYISSDRL